MALQAMWVHGNTARPQQTAGPAFGNGPLTDVNGINWTGIVGLPTGAGIKFRGRDNQSNWFHLCIPTPVILNGNRAKLQKVVVLYNTDPSVTVTDIHVWDGPSRLYTSNLPTGISGRHDGIGSAGLQRNINRWDIPNKPAIDYGVGISVQVKFSDEGNITFTSAGADFDA